MEPQRTTGHDPDPVTTQGSLWLRRSQLSYWETVVIIHRHKRRQVVAELLQALLDKHPKGMIFVTWDNFTAHQNDEVEAVVRSAAGRLVLLYLPTYSPGLNPIEMLWHHFRREVTHCELFENVKVLIEASYNFFDRLNKNPEKVLSVIGAHPSQLI